MMNELRYIRDTLLSLHNDVFLLVEAIERDRLSEVKHQYWKILDRRDAEDFPWDFEDKVIEHIDMRMTQIFTWDQEDVEGESNE